MTSTSFHESKFMIKIMVHALLKLAKYSDHFLNVRKKWYKYLCSEKPCPLQEHLRHNVTHVKNDIPIPHHLRKTHITDPGRWAQISSFQKEGKFTNLVICCTYCKLIEFVETCTMLQLGVFKHYLRFLM